MAEDVANITMNIDTDKLNEHVTITCNNKECIYNLGNYVGKGNHCNLKNIYITEDGRCGWSQKSGKKYPGL